MRFQDCDHGRPDMTIQVSLNVWFKDITNSVKCCGIIVHCGLETINTQW